MHNDTKITIVVQCAYARLTEHHYWQKLNVLQSNCTINLKHNIQCTHVLHYLSLDLLRIEKLDKRSSLRVGLGEAGVMEGKGHTSRTSQGSLPFNTNVIYLTSQLHMSRVD